MRPVGPEVSHTDCILVVGVSRPKLAALFVSVMLISLFLTFHVLYDSAVYNIQAAQAISEHKLIQILRINRNGLDSKNDINQQLYQKQYKSPNQLPADDMIKINHPMIFPNRVHFPKTSRRLPQVS